MRTSYKNPKELASHLRDLVDLYFEDLMTYEKLTGKVVKVVEVNELCKNGRIPVNVEIILGEQRLETIKQIILESKKFNLE